MVRFFGIFGACILEYLSSVSREIFFVSGLIMAEAGSANRLHRYAARLLVAGLGLQLRLLLTCYLECSFWASCAVVV